MSLSPTHHRRSGPVLLSGEKPVGQRRQVAEPVQKRLGREPRDGAAFGSEGDKRDRNAGGKAGLAISLGIADEERTRDIPARTFDRKPVRRRVGLAHRQRIGPDERAEKVAHPKPGHQQFCQPFGLVGADCRQEARPPQILDRGDGSRVKPRLAVDRRLVGIKQHRIVCVHPALIDQPKPREAKAKHGAAAMKGRQLVGNGIEKIALAQYAKAGIRGGDQIGGCVGQRAVKVKDYGSQGLAALLLRLCLKFAEKVCDPFSLAADPSIGKTGAS